MKFMANKEKWTLSDMKAELDEVVSSWSSKVPGLNNVKELEISKKMHKSLVATISVVGDATLDRVEKMTRIEKLKAAAASQSTVQDINILIDQFSHTTVMHKILRDRLKNNKPLPETPESAQTILQAEARKHLSAQQKKKMVAQQKRSMKSLKR